MWNFIGVGGHNSAHSNAYTLKIANLLDELIRYHYKCASLSLEIPFVSKSILSNNDLAKPCFLFLMFA